MRLAWLRLVLLISLISVGAQAQLGQPGPTADPDAPGAALGYRGAVRGKLGVELPLLPADDAGGPSASLSPLLELHEPDASDQPLPNQFWRGRLALAGAYSFRAEHELLRLSLGVSHESDHETAHAFSEPGFLALNAIGLGALWVLRAPGFALRAAIEARLYLASCTTRQAPCRDFAGSTSAGGAAALGADLLSVTALGFHPFGALFASGLFAHDLLRGERRLVAHAGVFHPMPSGRLELFALAWLGNDVGITRDRSLTQLGGGVAWTLELVGR